MSRLRAAVLILAMAVAPPAFAHGEDLIYCFYIIFAGAWLVPAFFVLRHRGLSRLAKSVAIAAMLLVIPLVWHLLWNYNASIFTFLIPSVTAVIAGYTMHLWEEARTE